MFSRQFRNRYEFQVKGTLKGPKKGFLITGDRRASTLEEAII